MATPRPRPEAVDPARGPVPLEIRPLAGSAELQACVELQHLTWGASFDGCVPASLLQVLVKVGALVAGAFTPEGMLAGFVFGVTGPRAGALVHWSHMLAVRPELRNHGIGQRLKHFQQRFVRELGVREMLWTYDPLVARNAHFNLDRLGARVIDFVPDMYGDTGSALHRSGTDRFIVSWLTNGHATAAPPSPAPPSPAPLPPEALRAPLVEDGVGALPVAHGGPRWCRIEIPPDMERLQNAEPAAARAWRLSTRAAFERCLAAGVLPVGFHRDGEGRCFYVLAGGGVG